MLIIVQHQCGEIVGKTVVDPGVADVTLQKVYNGVGIETDQGLFGIAQRDGGIEVMLNGKLVFSSSSLEEHKITLQELLAGALFDFIGFLTARSDEVSFGGKNECILALDLLKKFAELRGLNIDVAAVKEWNAPFQKVTPAE